MSKPQWRIDKERLVESYRRANLTALKGQVVFAGSSLMEMFPVQAWAQELGPDAPRVYNRGVGGYRTDDVLPIVDVLMTDLAPRRLFINIGTNDLSDASVTIPDLIGRYRQILARVRRCLPETDVILMAYYPINRDAATDEGMRRTLSVRTNERIREANTAVKALAQEMHCRFMDFNAPLTDPEGRLRAEFTTEGMHIRPEGYRAIWPMVAQAILAK